MFRVKSLAMGSFSVWCEDDVDAVHAKRIAFRAALGLRRTIGRFFLLLAFALALLEGIQVVQDVVPHFFQVFRHAVARIFFL